MDFEDVREPTLDEIGAVVGGEIDTCSTAAAAGLNAAACS